MKIKPAKPNAPTAEVCNFDDYFGTTLEQYIISHIGNITMMSQII